jgi:heme a synthase
LEETVQRLKVPTLLIASLALIMTVLLNLQGAVVRATGSGAGCGQHWPSCNGEVIPLSAGFATTLEFSHRLLTLLVLGFVLWLVLRAFKSRHERPGLFYAALVALFFLVLQSLVGAATVLFGYTGDDTRLARGFIVPLHLVNSMSMVGALVMAVLYARSSTPGRLNIVRQWPLASTLAALDTLLAKARSGTRQIATHGAAPHAFGLS